mgnify:CR=1 FL=1
MTLKESLKKLNSYTLVIIGFVLTTTSVFSFVLSWHNMDLAQNFEEINTKNNLVLVEYGLKDKIKYYETTLSGDVINDFQEVYADGVKHLFISLGLIMLGVFIFVMGIMDYEYRVGNMDWYWRK